MEFIEFESVECKFYFLGGKSGKSFDFPEKSSISIGVSSSDQRARLVRRKTSSKKWHWKMIFMFIMRRIVDMSISIITVN